MQVATAGGHASPLESKSRGSVDSALAMLGSAYKDRGVATLTNTSANESDRRDTCHRRVNGIGKNCGTLGPTVYNYRNDDHSQDS